MAYDQVEADRLRHALAGRDRLREQPMFGGICFMLRGHMLCGIGRQGFMFRVGEAQEAAALKRAGASPITMAGRRMRGFVWVDPPACPAPALRRWIELAERHVATLPARPVAK